MDIEFLEIDNYPKIDIKKLSISTEFNINIEEEITISINNEIILSKIDIFDIVNNEMILVSDTSIKEDDIITVIYNRI